VVAVDAALGFAFPARDAAVAALPDIAARKGSPSRRSGARTTPARPGIR
jgi:hypothetical protein